MGKSETKKRKLKFSEVRKAVKLKSDSFPPVSEQDLLLEDKRAVTGLERLVGMDRLGGDDFHCFVQGVRTVEEAKSIIDYIAENRDKENTPDDVLLVKHKEKDETEHLDVPAGTAQLIEAMVRGYTGARIQRCIHFYEQFKEVYIETQCDAGVTKLNQLNEEAKKLGFEVNVPKLTEIIKSKDKEAFLLELKKQKFKLSAFVDQEIPKECLNSEKYSAIEENVRLAMFQLISKLSGKNIEILLREQAISDAEEFKFSISEEYLNVFNTECRFGLDEKTIQKVRQPLADPKSKISEYVEFVSQQTLSTLAKKFISMPFEVPLSQGLKLNPDLGEKHLPNLFVDNSKTKGQPVIVVKKYDAGELFGYSKKKDRELVLVKKAGEKDGDKEHLNLVAGTVSKADEGYLVVDAWQLLINGQFREMLRVLETGEVDVLETPSFRFFREKYKVTSVPTKPKVVMYGSQYLWQALNHFLPEFSNKFKSTAYVSRNLKHNEELIEKYAGFIVSYAEKEPLPLEKEALEAIIEEGIRYAVDRRKISANPDLFKDLVRLAGLEALGRIKKEKGLVQIVKEDVKEAIRKEDVKEAIRKSDYIDNAFAERMKELQINNQFIIDVDGVKRGQINGLSVWSDGKFGTPSRITARVSVGNEGIHHLDQDIGNTGKSHQKSMGVLANLLAGKVSDKALLPLALNVSVAFEQSYWPHDGDSATVSQFLAVVSAITGFKIKQGYSVTGSADQHGNYQVIGGVNQKIEGVHAVCKAKGKYFGKGGDYATIIPEGNVEDLMLREEVVEDVKKGNYKILTTDRIEGVAEYIMVREDEEGKLHNLTWQEIEDRLVQEVKKYIQAAKKNKTGKTTVIKKETHTSPSTEESSFANLDSLLYDAVQLGQLATNLGIPSSIDGKAVDPRERLVLAYAITAENMNHNNLLPL